MIVWTQTIFSPVVSSALYIVVFGVSLSAVLKGQQGFSYLEFLIPGLIAMSALNNSLQNSASSVMISKFHNDLQDLRVIPLPPVLIMIAYSLSSLLRGLICATLVFLVGQIFMFVRLGSFLHMQNPMMFVIFLCLGSLFFGSIGIWAGFFSNSFDQVSALTQFVVLPLIYLGGVFYSIKMLDPFWQKIAFANPLVYIINGIRWSVLGVSDVNVWLCLVICLCFVVLGFTLAWRGVRKGYYLRF